MEVCLDDKSKEPIQYIHVGLVIVLLLGSAKFVPALKLSMFAVNTYCLLSTINLLV